MKPVRDLVFWYLKRKNLKAVPVERTTSGPPGSNSASVSVASANQGTTFAAALDRLRQRRLQLGTVIDVGASDGRWSAEFLPCQPKARYLCVEANPFHRAGLEAFAAKHPQAQFELCAAGDRDGQIYFDVSEPFGGLARESPIGSQCIAVPVSTIDTLVATHQLLPPYLIKLDTHGFELPILAGAALTLEQTEALIVEVYNFPGDPPAVSFHEFCRFLAGKGFRCADLFDPLYRPSDGALWQMDLVFLRQTRPEFQYPAYA
jgi:FkbM family methyltransferase